MKINAIKANGVEYDIWATESDVQALNNQGNAALGTEVESGKAMIAQAINNVGGTASSDESLSELAQDIEQIPSKGFYAGNVKLTGTPVNVLELMCNTAARQNIASNITEIDDDTITEITGGGFSDFSALKRVKMSRLGSISGGTFSRSGVETFDFPMLTSITNAYSFSGITSLKEFIAPNLSNFSGTNNFSGCHNITNIILGRLTSMSENLSQNKTLLRNVTIGEDTNINLPFQYWTATDVIAGGQSGIDELNSNLQTNLISKLYQGGNKILRLGAALYDVTTQETRDMVTAKGWTLQRG